jgi:hypothetical protein
MTTLFYRNAIQHTIDTMEWVNTIRSGGRGTKTMGQSKRVWMQDAKIENSFQTEFVLEFKIS